MPTLRHFATLLLLVLTLFVGSSAPTFVKTTASNSTDVTDSSSGSSAGDAAVEFPPFDAMEYYLTTNNQLLRLSGGKCWFGSMTCPATKEKVCIDGMDFVGCAFNAPQDITLDVVLPIVGDILSIVSGGVLDAPIKFAEEAIQDAFINFETCVRSLGCKEPNCDSMHTLKSCTSVATTVLGSGPAKAAIKKLAKLQADTATSAIDKLKTLSAAVETECKKGCDKGDCARETLVYRAPKGCKCAERFVPLPNYGGFSSNSCALNMRFYEGVQTEEDWKQAVKVDPGIKWSFPYIGCYVDANQTGCTSVYRPLSLPTLGFVPCVNQFDETRQLSASERLQGAITPPPTPSPTYENAGDRTSSALERRLWLLVLFAAFFAVQYL